MKINNYVWENDLSLNDLVLKQKEKIDELQTQLQQKENIIKKLEEFIEREIELYTIELIEENTNKLSIVAPIKGVYKEIYNVLQELKGSDK